MNVTGVIPAYIVKELHGHKLKEVHTKLADGKTKKVRDLRMFEVKFPRGHSNQMDEVAMAEQGLFEVAPSIHEEANEIIPGSEPKGYIGLVRGEFVVSNTEPPQFD